MGVFRRFSVSSKDPADYFEGNGMEVIHETSRRQQGHTQRYGIG